VARTERIACASMTQERTQRRSKVSSAIGDC